MVEVGSSSVQTRSNAEAGPVLFRSSPKRARNLLVVNKGPGAVSIPREEGAWDLLEIYFADQDIARITTDSSSTSADHIVFETNRQRRKFAIVKAVFEAHPDLRDYEAFAFFDDDVEPVGCSMASIFATFAASGCRVGQPALTHDSFYAHPIHLKNEAFNWRLGNCAELMCPMMTREGLAEYLPIFDATVSGFGLDDYWSFREWMKGYGVAVLDRTPVSHTRPVGGGGYVGLCLTDGQDLMRRHGIPRYLHSCYGGVLAAETSRESILFDLFTTSSGKLAQDGRFLLYIQEQKGILHQARLLAPECFFNEPGFRSLPPSVHLSAVLLQMMEEAERKRAAKPWWKLF